MWSRIRYSFGRWVSLWRWWRATAEIEEAENQTIVDSESATTLLHEQHTSALLKVKLDCSRREMRTHQLLFDRARRARQGQSLPLRKVMHSWLVLSFRQRTLRAEEIASLSQAAEWLCGAQSGQLPAARRGAWSGERGPR